MTRFTFKCEHLTGRIGTIELMFEANTWSEVLEEVGPFLRGCGYILPEGELEFVDYTDYKPEPGIDVTNSDSEE